MRALAQPIFIFILTAFTLHIPHGAAGATEFRVIGNGDEFVQLVRDRDLTRFGIRLQVLPEGEITGRGFGYNITGEWQWQGGYFCRIMAYGGTPIEPNCQQVAVNGSTIRFTSDQGAGEYADFRLR